MNKDSIHHVYMIPYEYISCPGCGQVYGHHNTKVDLNSEECSKCAKDRGNELELVNSKYFIEEIILKNM